MLFLKKKKALTLKRKIIKPNQYAFLENLREITVQGSVRELGAASFMGCRKLSCAEICNGTEVIGEKAFFNCSSLEAIKLPDSVKYIGECVFADCGGLKEIHLPHGLKQLPKGAFKNCTSLRRIVLPNELEVIGEECFSGCTQLQEIVFPDNLKKLEDKAFKRCESLKSIVLPKSLDYIGSSAFAACSELDYVELNSVLGFLGKQPFPGYVCSALQVSGTAYCSSFLTVKDEGQCPTVNIPRSIDKLLLGFDGMLTYGGITQSKTCFNHILSLEKNSIKVFIGENYYSYSGDSDYIIANGEFDFIKYDNEFSKASEFEKPFISAFRLVYSNSLTQENSLKYQTALAGNEGAVAVFCAERNEEPVLLYLLENSRFDSGFYTELYNIAVKNGNKNLLDIISLYSKNTGIAETEDLFADLL